MSIATPLSPPIVTARELAEKFGADWKSGHAAGDPFCATGGIEVIEVAGERRAYIVTGKPADVLDLSDVALDAIANQALVVVDRHRPDDASVFIVADRDECEAEADGAALAKLRAWKRK